MPVKTSYRTLSQENDFFTVRLQEINQEMEAILDRTNQQRYDLNKMIAGGGALAAEAARPGTAAAAAAACGYVAGSCSCQHTDVLVEQSVKKWCAAEMAEQLPSLLGPLVEKEVNKITERLANSIASLRETQGEIKGSLAELHEQWREQQLSVNNSISAMERNARMTLARYGTEIESCERRWQEELTAVKDSIQEVAKQSTTVEQRGTRRLDEVVRRHHDAVRNTHAELEGHVHTWKEELSAMMRGQVQTLKAQRDELEEHVARLQGTLSSTVEACNQQTVDVKGLMEDAMERRMEVNACRRDVNRLEMLVQCAGVFSGDNGGKSAAASFAAGQQASSPAFGADAVAPIARELSRVQERVSFLGGRVEGIDKHLQGLDVSIASLHRSYAVGAAAGGNATAGGGGGSFCAALNHSAVHHQVPAAHVSQSALHNHSVHSHHPLSMPVPSPVDTNEEVRRSHTASHHSAHRSSNLADSSSHMQRRTADNSLVASGDAAGSPIMSGRSQTNVVCQVLGRSSGAGSTSASPHSPIAEMESHSRLSRSESHQQKPPADHLNSSHSRPSSAAGSPFCRPPTPDEMDSYRSRSASLDLRKQQQQQGSQQQAASLKVSQLGSAAGSSQYAPPPTSDSESDRENQQLSRLAID